MTSFSTRVAGAAADAHRLITSLLGCLREIGNLVNAAQLGIL
jgi:hypothetical protein